MINNTKLYNELIIMGQSFMILSKDERTILLKRFGFTGEKETLDSIGKELDISRQRVQQKQERAIYKLEIAHDTLTKNI